MNIGDWAWSQQYQQVCSVIDEEYLWGTKICKVWLPDQDTVIRVTSDQLKPLNDHSATISSHQIAYLAAASRVADALTQDLLLAPIESSVIPLPHQIRALYRAIANDRIRYLLADEVGLGKTIEAGLIMRELKLRGRVRRTLVVAPKGLVTQWVAEMRLHFNEEFQLLLPEDLKTLRRISTVPRSELRVAGSVDSRPGMRNPWTLFSQVIVPIDSFKPMDKRRGWTREEVADYNRERFENLITAGWDLIIVDEAHRLGGSTEQVARHKMGMGLAEAAPYILLLTATPHQGKTDAFHRLISLLDSQAFPDVESISRDRVRPYVIRTEKRRAIDAQGKSLFMPRQTQLISIGWQETHREQRLLYDAVTEYVRNGYNQAIKEKKSYIGFLMILMQRLVSSSTNAIRITLERRLEVLQVPEEQLPLFPEFSEEEWVDLDGQEQMEGLLGSRLKAMKNERQEVRLLLEVARRAEQAGPDIKAASLLEWIYGLQQEEGDPELKILVFTEFVQTQEMLRDFLGKRGFSVVCLNGSMGMEERISVQDAFSKDAQILVSTDAGGEGLNLQFCHVVINYDIPWNPMRLEQRIGRVDRIGQNHRVQAINFIIEDTVEYRVREVLEEKLSVILEEFGVDKTGDVLDSAQAGQIFDGLYLDAILSPESIETHVEKYLGQIRRHVQANRDNLSVLGEPEELSADEAQNLLSHPLPHWVERMTVSYLRSRHESCGISEEGKTNETGAEIVGNIGRHNVWRLKWPDGSTQEGVFTQNSSLTARHLGLEDHRIRNLAERLPRFAPGQPIPCIDIPELPSGVKGFWSLWRISLQTYDWKRQRVMPLFLHDDGRNLRPTAQFIWDQLLSFEPILASHVESLDARRSFDLVRAEAEKEGKRIYEELLQVHRERLEREVKRFEYAFAARRRAIERIGLQAVRKHRLAQLEEEERAWQKMIEEQENPSPEMIPIIIIKVMSNGC